jgi:hypothetical protein
MDPSELDKATTDELLLALKSRSLSGIVVMVAEGVGKPEVVMQFWGGWVNDHLKRQLQ